MQQQCAARWLGGQFNSGVEVNSNEDDVGLEFRTWFAYELIGSSGKLNVYVCV